LSAPPDPRPQHPMAEPHWPDIRVWLQANPDHLASDRSLLAELGLRAQPANVVDFGPAALTRLEAAASREQDARLHIETVARANFAAQTQTHALTLDVMEARSHSDLARRLNAAVRARFDLAGAAIVLERPGGVPFGWRALEAGGVDRWLGEHGMTWFGPTFEEASLFGDAAEPGGSVALVRMSPHVGAEGQARSGLCVFTSGAPDGFTTDMGGELVTYIAKVVERMAERWPILN